MRGRHFLTALGVNAVPAAGWFAGNWSPGTTLLLYWIETLLGTLLLACRILLHRRVCPSRGHWDYKAPPQPNARSGGRSTFLVAFLVPSLVFTFAHAFFLAVFGGLVLAKTFAREQLFDPESLLEGVAGMGFFLVIDFLLDLPGLRERPFHWIEQQSLRNLARVVLVHLAIIGGMGVAVFMGARNFFSVFIVMKTLCDSSLHLPQWKPKKPPKWFSALMNRMRSPNDKETFEEFYEKGDVQEEARRARNEEPCARTGG